MYKTVSRGERLFWIESTVGTAYTVGVIERPYGTNDPSTTGTLLVLPPGTRTLSSHQVEQPSLLPNPGLGQQWTSGLLG